MMLRFVLLSLNGAGYLLPQRVIMGRIQIYILPIRQLMIVPT